MFSVGASRLTSQSLFRTPSLLLHTSAARMGIKGLTKLLNEHAPNALSETEMKHLFGRKVAIDASMSIYQFMIAVRSAYSGSSGGQLTNDAGEVTSHLQGIFYRTYVVEWSQANLRIRMIENGVKPCYVFDGKPPDFKSDELEKRKEKREEAENMLKQATEAQNFEEMEKYSKRTVKVTKEHSEECKKLLELMGVPFIQATSEAEATCAALCKAGHVYGTATEDMDALTFGTPILLRHMTFSAARKMPIQVFNLKEALEALELSHAEFRDLCILCGCDYSGTIRGIGPGRALTLIKKHRNIETILENLDTKKYSIPEDFNYEMAWKLFDDPDITDVSEVKLEWKDPDEEGLIDFLVNEKGFALERMNSGIRKLKAAKGKGAQQRIESFFGAPVKKSKRKETKKPAKKATKTKSKVKKPKL